MPHYFCHYIIIANCGRPELLLTHSSNDSVPRVEGYDGFPIERSTITFSCPPEMEFTGPNSATCMDDGEWELDLRGLMCAKSKSIGNFATIIINYSKDSLSLSSHSISSKGPFH